MAMAEQLEGQVRCSRKYKHPPIVRSYPNNITAFHNAAKPSDHEISKRNRELDRGLGCDVMIRRREGTRCVLPPLLSPVLVFVSFMH